MQVAINLDKAAVANYHRQMLTIRRFEEASGRLYMQGRIRGFLHLYIGQEAVAVGAISSLNEDDYVVTHYRDHGHALAKGMAPRVIMAELCGKATGSSGGKGGSMHLFDVSKRFMGGYAIVAGQLPIAVGIALGIKYKHENSLVMCFLGDGAINEGEFHESMNLASLWELPILFYLENNLYGMGSHVDRTHAGGRDLYLSAESYKVPGAQVDGMDIVAVREATTEALERIRSGGGPVFLEAMTYRFRGHSMADPASYRQSSEVDVWRESDPIERFKKQAIENDLITEEEISSIDSEVETVIEEAVNYALQSPDAEMDSLFEHIYAEPGAEDA